MTKAKPQTTGKLKTALLCALTLCAWSVSGRSVPTSYISSNTDAEALEEKLVKGLIENFLSVIGHYDLDSLETFFAEHAISPDRP